MTGETRAGLDGSRCRVCGRASCPPQMMHCGAPTDRATLRPTGTVEAWSVARVAPQLFEPPYAFAYVRLDDGPRVFARLPDWSEGDAVRDGEPVVVTLGVTGRSPQGPVAGLVATRQEGHSRRVSGGETR